MGLARGHEATDSAHSASTSKSEASSFPGPRVAPTSSEKRHLDFGYFWSGPLS